MGTFIVLSLTTAIAWSIYMFFTKDGGDYDDHDDWDDSWGI